MFGTRTWEVTEVFCEERVYRYVGGPCPPLRTGALVALREQVAPELFGSASCGPLSPPGGGFARALAQALLRQDADRQRHDELGLALAEAPLG